MSQRKGTSELAQEFLDATDALETAKRRKEIAIANMIDVAKVTDRWTIYEATSGRLVGVMQPKNAQYSPVVAEMARGK